MILNVLLGSLALLALVLLLWQWLVAVGFPLHQRMAIRPDAPAVTLLKSLKGCDAATEDCLRSWFAQEYPGEIQILFGVASADDPVCDVAGKLMSEFPKRDAQLIVCHNLLGANAKASKLAELEKFAKHGVLCISDSDVRVPPDFLANAVAPLRDERVGLVNCFYRLANPTTIAMQWEAIAVNADFWSQVLQSRSLKPLDFALGAVMVLRRQQLDEIGGSKAFVDCLADDYQLGNRLARKGYRIELCPVVVECWEQPMGWRAVWKHQLRWARTIRVCQPLPYFFSILSNVGFWAMLCLVWNLPAAIYWSSFKSQAFDHGFVMAHIVLGSGIVLGGALCLVRILIAHDLQRRLTHSSRHASYFWLVPIKDLLQVAIWFCAFAGNRIEWRGQKFRLRRDGTLEPIDRSPPDQL